MSRQSQQIASFYKFLLHDDFTSQLRIPPQFAQNYAGKLPSEVTLSVKSQGSWKVRVKKMGQHYFFVDGWNRFCMDVNLELKEFLLFKFDGESEFSVSVYAISGCEKELLLGRTSSGEQNAGTIPGNHDVSVKEESGDDDKPRSASGVENWRFVTKLKKHNEYQLELPRDLARRAEIPRNREMHLRTYAKWKRWPIRVTVRKNGSFAITGGWNQFLLGTKVCIGSTISLEFYSSLTNVIQFKVLKHGNLGLYSAKKGRGRPPIFSNI